MFDDISVLYSNLLLYINVRENRRGLRNGQ
jgi:hypothetical protein